MDTPWGNSTIWLGVKSTNSLTRLTSYSKLKSFSISSMMVWNKHAHTHTHTHTHKHTYTEHNVCSLVSKLCPKHYGWQVCLCYTNSRSNEDMHRWANTFSCLDWSSESCKEFSSSFISFDSLRSASSSSSRAFIWKYSSDTVTVSVAHSSHWYHPNNIYISVYNPADIFIQVYHLRKHHQQPAVCARKQHQILKTVVSFSLSDKCIYKRKNKMK